MARVSLTRFPVAAYRSVGIYVARLVWPRTDESVGDQIRSEEVDFLVGGCQAEEAREDHLEDGGVAKEP